MNAFELAAPLTRMLGDHAEDVYAVIAALTGREKDQVRCTSGEDILRALESASPASVDVEELMLYQAQMLWLISAQLHSLCGNGSFPVPDALSLLEAPSATFDLLKPKKGGSHDHTRKP